MKIMPVIFLAASLVLAPYMAPVYAKGSPIHNYPQTADFNCKPVLCGTKAQNAAGAFGPRIPTSSGSARDTGRAMDTGPAAARE